MSVTFCMWVTLLVCLAADLTNGDTLSSPASRSNPRPHYLTQAAAKARQPSASQLHTWAMAAEDILLDLRALQMQLLDGRYNNDIPLTKHSAVASIFQAANTTVCLEDTLRLVFSFIDKNKTWSLQFLDASGKPGPGLMRYHLNFVGNYKECREAQAPGNASQGLREYKGIYCTLSAVLPSDSFMPFGIKLGACMPDTCSNNDLTLLTSLVLKALTNSSLVAGPAECHIGQTEMTSATVAAIEYRKGAPVDYFWCSEPGRPPRLPLPIFSSDVNSGVKTITVLSIIGLLVLVGTIVDLVFVQWPKWQRQMEHADLLTNHDRVGSTYGGGDDADEKLLGQNETDDSLLLLGKPEPQVGFCGKMLLCFSIYSNGAKLLSTSENSGALGAVHGVRFLSMSWVLLCHVFAFGVYFFNNIENFPSMLDRWTFTAIANGFASVDTFFTLSGLLTAYLTCQQMTKRGWKLNWGLYYFHRFWRLTPTYMLVLLMVLGFQQYLGSGALWEEGQPADRENCNSYWWANLLYINNLVDVSKMCFGHSWYLSNDMQFFLISPILIIPFYFKTVVGVAVCLAFLLATFITTAVLSVQNEWPVTMVSENTLSLIGHWFEDYYIKPWCRLGPYIIGVLTGVLLSRHKRLHLPKYTVVLGWMVAFAVGLAVVYGIHGDVSGNSRSSVGMAAFYNAISRSAWAVAVCWVIVACAYGYGGIINSFLSWSPFVVLGRLTFVMYLVHPTLLFTYFENMEQLYYVTDTNIAVTFCGMLVCTNLVSFLMVLLFESPMIGLEKLILRRSGAK